MNTIFTNGLDGQNELKGITLTLKNLKKEFKMSKTLKRIYLVENNLTAGKILVQAATAGQAVNAVIKDAYTVKVATGIEVAELVKNGCPVVVAETKTKESLMPAPTKESIPEDGGEDGDMIGGEYRAAGE